MNVAAGYARGILKGLYDGNRHRPSGQCEPANGAEAVGVALVALVCQVLVGGHSSLVDGHGRFDAR